MRLTPSIIAKLWSALFPLLWPLATMFGYLVRLRRYAYTKGWLTAVSVDAPVIIIGNIQAGGSGKTPLLIHLATELQARGWRIGIISRGYGGRYLDTHEVKVNDSATTCGDEPLLIKQRTGLPVYVSTDRVKAARHLLRKYACDVLLSDDGMQHYRLQRWMEVAVVDERTAEDHLLPAGHLREPVSRLCSVDAIVQHGESHIKWPHGIPLFHMQLRGHCFFNLLDANETCHPQQLIGLQLTALVGIGSPQRFLDHLNRLGLACKAAIFPDHHIYCAEDIPTDCDALLSTEKDAVKLRLIMAAGHPFPICWILPVSAQVKPDLAALIEEKLHGRAPS